MPSATPTEAELVAWAALSREAQLDLYQAALTDRDCGVATDDSMAEILIAARERVAARQRG
jgi:hypothetical protein